MHPGDGGTSAYLPLIRFLRSRPTVLAFAAWDLRRRQWPRTTVQEIAADYVEQLQCAWPEGPVHLGGWSAGAVLAYEMAVLLRRAGRDVLGVAMVDPFNDWDRQRPLHDLPLAPPDTPFTQDDWTTVLRMLALGDCLPEPGHALWSQPQALQTRGLLEAMRVSGRVPLGLKEDAFAYLCAVVRHHCQAYDHYRPTLSDVDFTLFLPQPQDGAPDSERWPALTRGQSRTVVMAGDHMSMVRAPHVAHIAQVLDSWYRPSR